MLMIVYESNLYFPRDCYFRRLYPKLTEEERRQFAEQMQALEKYPHLGELVCLDEWLVFCKLGVVISYDRVRRVFRERLWTRGGFRYVVTIETVDSKKYRFSIWNNDTPFVGADSAYSRIVEWVFSHKNKMLENR